jgi:4a-hydroxytetrahydrobiopterin dehydratase
MWSVVKGKLYKKFVFIDFETAFEFMKEVAKIVMEVNHHPDWRNIYNIVEINLFSFEQNTISEKDTQLAEKIDAIFKKLISN